MVDPFLAGPTMAGFGYIGYLISKYGPSRTVPFGCYGMQSVGKSAMQDANENKFYPVVHRTRVPTTQLGVKYKTKFHLENAHIKDPYIKGQDIPHDLEFVRPQILDIKPGWIVWMLDVLTWKDPANWKYLEEIAQTIGSSEYQKGHRAKIPMITWSPSHGWSKGHLRKYKGCKLVTMVINKIDLWETYTPQTRARGCREIVSHYTKQFEGNPMHKLDTDFHFIAASVEQGNNYEFNDLEGPSKPLRTYVNEIMEFL